MLIAALLSFVATNARANADDVPAWLANLIEEQTDILAADLGLAREPFLELSYHAQGVEQGRRIIDAEAEAQVVRIDYGGAWQVSEPTARRDAIRNLAHELAHVWQYELGMPTEPRFLHEGFAEAMAIHVLDECGAICGVQPGTLMMLRERECGDALRLGTLARNTSREAIYGCGAVMVAAVATAAGTDPQGLYRQFAGTERSFEAFQTLAKEAAGASFSISARAFWQTNHRLAQPSRVIASLRAGRL
ncbi:MAG: hypothetical protein AAF830_05935 [Pseudomonadota bacterium]